MATCNAGTTAPKARAALSIVKTGYCVPSEGGVCGGPGIYMFEMPHGDLTTESIQEGWKRTKSGGYNHGCMVICRLTGVVINGTNAMVVVPGAISHEKKKGAIRSP